MWSRAITAPSYSSKRSPRSLWASTDRAAGSYRPSCRKVSRAGSSFQCRAMLAQLLAAFLASSSPKALSIWKCSTALAIAVATLVFATGLRYTS